MTKKTEGAPLGSPLTDLSHLPAVAVAAVPAHVPKATRETVYAAIDTERTYQDKKWLENSGAVEGAPVRTVAEELLMIDEYVRRARTAWTDEARATEAEVVVEILRKIAAIAVRAMENHGAPGRFK